MPRDALAGGTERGERFERSGARGEVNRVAWRAADGILCMPGGGWAVKGARTNDEAREPSGPYAREHAIRVPGAVACARDLNP